MQTIESSKLQLDPTPVELPTAIPFINGQTNRKLLHAAQTAAGVSISFPCDTPIALKLVQLMGYKATPHDLKYIFATRDVTPPATKGRAYVWAEGDIVRLADVLYEMRKFNCFPGNPHAPGFTPEERRSLAAEQQTRLSFIQQFEEIHPLELLGMMVEETNRTQRELMAIALKIQSGLIHARGTEAPGTSPESLN